MEDQETQGRGTEEFINVLPKELQTPTRDFMRKLTKSLLAQQNRLEGDSVSVRVTPEQVNFYSQRFDEILDSGLLNPHVNPPKKIS